ncbi:MAG: DUF2341 domain-containing protein [Fibromonadaceae bacterium]|jgi:predicted acyltransferase (DUF342 family)|nr:DUF2341 domain-containing protein [Fibromonadaceae bacterium]
MQVVFAESNSRTMRVGESQYFSIDSTGQDFRIKLVSVQNGVAVLEKEYLKKQIPELQYYYAAQGTADAVLPILLQPYPAQVTAEHQTLYGISEDLELRLYRGDQRDFSTAVWLESAEFIRNGSNFSIQVSLAMGENHFFISYAPGIVGERAIASIQRKEASRGALNADLDPIGSAAIRTTALKIENASLGTMEAFETIFGEPHSRTQMEWNEAFYRFEVENTQTKASERSFHLSHLGNDGKIRSSQTIVIPVDDILPVIREIDSPQRFVPGSASISGNFTDNLGVRFVWLRLMDNAGIEVARTYVETGKLPEGSMLIDFPNTGNMNLKVYAVDGSVLGAKVLELPREALLKGNKYTLEVGVTDIAGNRSDVKKYEVSAFVGHKEWNISLVNAMPKNEVQAYPLLLRIGEKDMDFSTASPTGSDLRFLDEKGNNLAFEVERFDARKKQAEVWVRIPRITANTLFIRLNMLWGNAEAEHYGKPSSVWDDGFRGVYHFNEMYLGPYIPETDFSDYTVYVTGNASFRERARLNGTIAASGTIQLGMDSKVDNVKENLKPLEMTIVPLPQPGTHDINISSNGSTALLPGKYQDLTIGAGSRVKLSAGTYHFRNVKLSQDAVIEADISRGVVTVKVAGNMNIAERSQIALSGNTKASMFRCDVSASNVSFGTDVKWKGILTAPNATVNIGERMSWTGALYAQGIVTGTDVSFIPSLSEAQYAIIPADDDIFPPATLAGFDLFATQNIVLQNNSKINGQLGSNGNLSLGYDARLYGDAWVLQNLSLGNQSTLTGSVLLGGSLSEGANVNWSGSVIPLLESGHYTIPEVNVNAGAASITVGNDQIHSLTPGSYGNLVIRTRGTLQITAGIYHFASLQVESDGIVSADMSKGIVEVMVAGNANFSDRAKFIRSGSDNFNDLKFFFATNNSIRYGHDINFKGAIRAPSAEVILGDRNSYTGTLWARRIEIGNGSSFISERLTSGNNETDIEAIHVSDWIADATRFRRNGFNTSSTAKRGFIAESQFFNATSHIRLPFAEYVRNGQGTWSSWLYLDEASGRIASSSDVSVPNWEWKLNDEGNLIIRIGSRSLSLPVPDKVWVLLSIVQNGNEISVYLNDILQAKGSAAGDLSSTANPWFGSSAGVTRFDEIRISETARSEDWIRLDYHTQKVDEEENEAITEFAKNP